MSAPNKHSSAHGALAGSAGRLTADGRAIYRLTPPVVIWWTWVAVTVLSLGDLVVQGHDFVSLRFALGWLTATGVVFACTLWPRVVASEDGITVQNPLRAFVIPWGAVTGIFLAESVEVSCARGGGKKDKVVSCWALAARRRVRSRAQLRRWQQETGRRSTSPSYDRLPADARELTRLTVAELFARELAQLHEQSKGRAQVAGPAPGDGSPMAVLSARWQWQPVVATLVPAAGFAVTLLVR